MKPAVFVLALILAWPWASAGVAKVEGQASSQLADVLRAAGRYVDQYQRSFTVVVSRESYQQRLFTGAKLETRDLRSEVALVALDDSNWILFRDVYEVDGRSISDRNDRLTQLFLKPTADLGQQARRILEESARFNRTNHSHAEYTHSGARFHPYTEPIPVLVSTWRT